MTVSDVFFLIGFILLIGGIALIHIPTAVIIAGLILITIGMNLAMTSFVNNETKK